MPKSFLKLLTQTKRSLIWLCRQPILYWRKGWWQKTVSIVVLCLALVVGTMYGIAVWYQHSQKGEPTTLGVSFVADYATSLGLDAHETYLAILNDLQVKQLRLVSYWSDIEPTEGKYDFSELDWEMQQAAAHGAKVSLAIGLRQPRWPECHAPSWADTSKPASSWQPQLEAFMTAVVNRYKSSPALVSYQLENEYFNHFGQCYNFDRSRLTSELQLVKKLDPARPVILSRSNNYTGLMLRQPLPDTVGISVYRRVWNTFLWQRYFQYPFPSWYYSFLAGAEQLFAGKPSVIHELQTEPWPPNGKNITDVSLTEQNKTFDAQRFQATVKFAEQTGIKHIDMWGAEYWYYRMVTLHDPSVWQTAENIFTQP
jgi:hypothetical protein